MARIKHIALSTDDPAKTAEFYKRVFGWEIRKWEGAPVDYRLITTGDDERPGINGAIVERRGGLDGKAVTAFVCTIDVDDLAAIEAAVPDSDVLIHVEPEGAVHDPASREAEPYRAG